MKSVRLTFEDGEREVLLARLGLPADADDSALMARVGEWIQEDPTSSNGNSNTGVEGQTGNLDDDASGDYVVVDVASFTRMRRQEAVAAQVVEAQRTRDRDELIEEAIHDGKFGPSRRDHYKARYDSDPEGTKSLIARLMPNTVPLEARGANAPDEDEVSDDSYPTEWLSASEGQRHNRDQDVTKPRSRVHSES